MGELIRALPRDLVLALLGVAAGLATLCGGALALRFRDRIHLVLGFSAGAVIGVGFFDLLPEALDLGRVSQPPAITAPVVGAGFIAYMLINRLFWTATRGDQRHRGHLGAASLTVHSLLDGFGIGFAFQVSAGAGAVVALAVLAHDFCDGVNTVNLSLAGAGEPRTARRWLMLDACAPLLGIGLARLITVPQTVLAPLIAVFAGFFLYIGASELLPQSDRSRPGLWTGASTLAGAAFIYAAVQLAG